MQCHKSKYILGKIFSGKQSKWKNILFLLLLLVLLFLITPFGKDKNMEAVPGNVLNSLEKDF